MSGIQCFMVEFTRPVANGEPHCKRLDTGEEADVWPWNLGPGAMWWGPFRFADRRLDRALWVHTPGGDWCIDGPSWNTDKATGKVALGPGWTRTGEPPNVTATPSINIVGSFHGWLRNGELTDA